MAGVKVKDDWNNFQTHPTVLSATRAIGQKEPCCSCCGCTFCVAHGHQAFSAAQIATAVTSVLLLAALLLLFAFWRYSRAVISDA